MSDSDMITGLITYMFREDIQAHPIPPHRAAQLRQTIHCFLSKSDTDLQTARKRDCAHGQAENDSPGDQGPEK